MASDATDLLDHQDNDVGVTVQAQFMQLLHMTRFFTFAPEFATRTRPIDGTVLGRRQAQGLAVHPGHHQHPAGLVILSDCRHQTVAVPVNLVQPVFHIYSGSRLSCPAD